MTDARHMYIYIRGVSRGSCDVVRIYQVCCGSSRLVLVWMRPRMGLHAGSLSSQIVQVLSRPAV